MVSCLSTLSIQRSKHAMHWMLCYVDTIDTGVFTPHSTLYKVLSKSQCFDKHSIQCIVCFDLHIDSVDKQDTTDNIQKHCYIYYICRYCWYRARISNALNAIYVDTVDTKHIHTFLPIIFLILKPIFNLQKSFGKLRLRAFQPYHQILYMLTLLTLGISISDALLPITFLRSHPNSFLYVCQQCWQTRYHTQYTIALL